MAGKNSSKKPRKIFIIILAIVIISVAGTCITMKILFPGISFPGAASFKTVTSSVNAFSYEPAKIEPGTVYHYVKSNIDGSKPADVTIFVSSDEHLEVFKIYPGSNATFYVTADMDWEVFSPKALDGYEIYKDGSRKLIMHAELSKEKNEYTYNNGKDQYSVPIGHFPMHNYNFDLTSLNFTFRQLTNPKSDFSVGIHYPAFDLVHFVKFVYTGQVNIKYLSDEIRNMVTCRKYEIGGEGFANKTGTVWVNKDKGYIEDIEIPLADNPSWNSFKLKLTSVEVMSQDAWNSYIITQSKEYFDKLGK